MSNQGNQEKNSVRGLNRGRKSVRNSTRRCPDCRGNGRIRDLRKDFNRVEVGEIAKAAGKSISMISRFLKPPSEGTKRRDTTFRTARKIATYLGVTMDELWSIVTTER